MYDDSPDWRVMFNMLEGMYHNHPVKIDIAGTVETIAEITAEKLYEVYNVFYNLKHIEHYSPIGRVVVHFDFLTDNALFLCNCLSRKVGILNKIKKNFMTFVKLVRT